MRLGYYLEFLAAALSPYFAPKQLENILLGFCAITLGSYAAVFEDAVGGYYVTIDWIVMLL